MPPLDAICCHYVFSLLFATLPPLPLRLFTIAVRYGNVVTTPPLTLTFYDTLMRLLMLPLQHMIRCAFCFDCLRHTRHIGERRYDITPMRYCDAFSFCQCAICAPLRCFDADIILMLCACACAITPRHASRTYRLRRVDIMLRRCQMLDAFHVSLSPPAQQRAAPFYGANAAHATLLTRYAKIIVYAAAPSRFDDIR